MITRRKSRLLIIGWILIPFTGYTQDLRFQEEEDGIRLLEEGKPRFFYQTDIKSLDGQYPRANYIHPLYGLNGEVLTEDFPADHLHHHGIFWAWHQLYAEGKRVGDPWISEGVSWEVHNTSTNVNNGEAMIESEIMWMQDSEKRPVVREKLRITYEKLEEEVFSLTFDIQLTALVEGVRLGGSEDEKGYGGFSPRFILPEDISFQSTEGMVEPQNLPVQAGPWMNLKGSFGSAADGASGIVIMGEPGELPSYQGWILRNAKSMQNMAFPGREPLSIEKGKSLSFRNQILVHKELNPTEIQEYYNRFQVQKSNKLSGHDLITNFR